VRSSFPRERTPLRAARHAVAGRVFGTMHGRKRETLDESRVRLRVRRRPAPGAPPPARGVVSLARTPTPVPSRLRASTDPARPPLLLATRRDLRRDARPRCRR
jgi:hypothetical protein